MRSWLSLLLIVLSQCNLVNMTTIKGKHVKDKDQIKYMKIRNDELEFLDKVSAF